MTERDTLLQIYTSEENKELFDQLADAAGTSTSEYGHEVIEDYVEWETGENQYQRYSTNTKIEVLLEEAKREVTELLAEFESGSMEEVKTVQKVRTAYIIAIWKLLQDDYSAEQRRLALKFAGEHVGQDPDTESQTPDEENNAESDASAATEPAGESA
ncbi:hypothetical protein Har1130_18865 [Haloarcula sp. CBA1130]|uniref:hypothetical protein n=1 Tax=unclassified Haloarcula TaxID=2624677 RepID=UPI001245790D|nr:MULTISPECIES: hypothetical protein [unclassified Haloarcula]KAA9396345.1 hypothetical protein Har1130_18865 [Haloarcula sp. CBA1130]KAA9397483.1 hypothetical protein Har1129_04145 [Haloarcula sp. CBA1129]